MKRINPLLACLIFFAVGACSPNPDNPSDENSVVGTAENSVAEFETSNTCITRISAWDNCKLGP